MIYISVTEKRNLFYCIICNLSMNEKEKKIINIETTKMRTSRVYAV